jgi:hypothetical protein
MKKCNWKDGKFDPCEGFDGHVRIIQDYTGHWKTVCKSCHTDIRKPEEEPIIEKSGNTWVAHWKGVDYISTWTKAMGRFVADKSFKNCVIDKGYHGGINVWQSFTGDNPDITELTDEIALLRPMVRYGISLKPLDQLVHVILNSSQQVFNESTDKYTTITSGQLATVQDIRNNKWVRKQ